jgi:methanogenesis imperfect marker protein 11
MMTRDEILNEVKDKPWVSPFEKIIGLYSRHENIVQLYEYHARSTSYGAAAWAVHHYKRTSPLVVNAQRDGIRDIFTLNIGSGELKLQPSFSSAGIEAVKLDDDRIQITYAGLAGGGVGGTLCRALAQGVIGAQIHSEGGGDKLGRATLILPQMMKLHVGIDDTDKPGAGATWSLANEIGFELSKSDGIEYLNHTLVQLYPGTPEKTTNCVTTVLTFAVEPNKMQYLRENLVQHFTNNTLSDHTGLAFFENITIPEKLTDFSDLARKQVVTLDETIYLANNLGIDLYPKNGARGCIGAVAGLGYAENHEEAVKID